MLEIEPKMENYFKIDIKINRERIRENYYKSVCWLCDRALISIKRCSQCNIGEWPNSEENKIVIDHCHLNGRFKGLAHINRSLNTGKSRNSVVPFFLQFFRIWLSFNLFEKLVNMAIEKGFEIKNMIFWKKNRKTIYV